MYSFPFDGKVQTTKELTAEDQKTVTVPVLDRSFTSAQLRKVTRQLYTDGIAQSVTNCFKVSPGNGMNILVQPGAGSVGGGIAIEDQVRTIQVQASHPTLDRIDSVVLRLDDNINYRNIDLYVVKGIEGERPNSKPPVRNDSVYEIVLAHVFVARGTNTISNYRITDTRLDTSICGLMQPRPGVDTEGIFTQYQDALDQFLDTVKGALDGTLAGNLQNQINAISTNAKKSIRELDGVSRPGSLTDAMLAKELNESIKRTNNSIGELQGNTTGKMLRNVSQIMSNNAQGYFVDALAAKEIIQNMNQNFSQDLSQFFQVGYGWEVTRKYFRKVGGMVFAYFTVHPTGSWAVNKKYTVFRNSLPQNLKPLVATISAGVAANGDLTQPTNCAFLIGSNGDIEIIVGKDGGQGTITGYFSCNMVYAIKGA